MLNNLKYPPSSQLFNEFKNHPECFRAVTCTCYSYGGKCDVDCENREMGVECQKGCSRECTNQKIRRGIPDKYLRKCRQGTLGFGCKAAMNINKGEYVAEYIGIHKPKLHYEKEQRENPYRQLYSIESLSGYVIDATEVETKAKYINETCSPNLESVCFIVDQVPRVVLVALRFIKKGEERQYL